MKIATECILVCCVDADAFEVRVNKRMEDGYSITHFSTCVDKDEIYFTALMSRGD